MKFSAKALLGSALVVASLSSSAFAFTPNTYRPGQYSCADMRAIVQKEGMVNLVLFLGANQMVVANASQCPSSTAADSVIWEAQNVNVATSDTWFCNVGFDCVAVARNEGGSGR